MKTFTDSEGFEWGWDDELMSAFVVCGTCGKMVHEFPEECLDGHKSARKHQSEFFFRPNKYDFEDISK